MHDCQRKITTNPITGDSTGIGISEFGDCVGGK